MSITSANINDGRAGPEALPDDPGEVFADSAYRGNHFCDAVRAKGGIAFLAAQRGDAVLAAQAIQHDPDLVLSREVPTGLPTDILHHPLSRAFIGELLKEGLGFIFVPSSLRLSPNPP